ncbi:alpha/beta hydrolase [Roseateles cellulosilyticus]|uniref:Alpha/beta hydrolase n=1 Tax=Pelomonas cellulosilytica TaxID=2906762 RepID=A0ABS8XSC0_9BURK|nr:alpha/beta hydrolase [Pelomonas sp. P8]MCE4553782.1 alpha/beta hydrolase [Pelomonas sp. P8]
MAWKKLGLTLLALAALGGALAFFAPTKVLNFLASSHTHTRYVGASYGAGPRQDLDVYRPSRTAPRGGWPVVVFFYGGSWRTGDRGDFAFVGEALASRGMLTLVVDYRLYPEVGYPGFLQDGATAVAWALKNAERLGGDPRRVFVMGHSAGAYNAAMLALDPRWLKAAGRSPRELAGFIGLAGPYDFLPIENPDVKPVFNHPDYPPGTQPIDYGGRGAPRTFLGAARQDKLVDPQRNTQALAAKLQAAGVPVTVKLYDRVSHMTLIGTLGTPLRWLAPVLDDVTVFVNGG